MVVRERIILFCVFWCVVPAYMQRSRPHILFSLLILSSFPIVFVPSLHQSSSTITLSNLPYKKGLEGLRFVFIKGVISLPNSITNELIQRKLVKKFFLKFCSFFYFISVEEGLKEMVFVTLLSNCLLLELMYLKNANWELGLDLSIENLF